MSMQRSVVLEKVSNLFGAKPVGDVFIWTFTTSSPDVARQRAWRALKRELPDENPMCWKEIGDE